MSLSFPTAFVQRMVISKPDLPLPKRIGCLWGHGVCYFGYGALCAYLSNGKKKYLMNMAAFGFMGLFNALMASFFIAKTESVLRDRLSSKQKILFQRALVSTIETISNAILFKIYFPNLNDLGRGLSMGSLALNAFVCLYDLWQIKQILCCVPSELVPQAGVTAIQPQAPVAEIELTSV